MVNLVLDAALHYERLGLSVIPMKYREKKPALQSWTGYQEKRASHEQIVKWFRTERNVAIVLGEVSQGVVVRDFDDMTSYQRWASEHAEYARTLPTVETARGRHVYARIDLSTFRQRFLAKILTLGDGEFKTSGLVVAPPSVHPSGAHYRWLIPLVGLPPVVELDEVGFVPCNREDREDRDYRGNREHRDTESTEIQKIHRTFSAAGSIKPWDWNDFPAETANRIQRAILDTVPKTRGKRHELVFKLCRALKAIPEVRDAAGPRLMNFVRHWWELSKAVSPTAWEEHLADFLEGWGLVKFALGEDPLDTIFQRAVKAEIPTVATKFELPQLQLLISFCRELQRESGDRPFFLSVRTAGRLLGIHYTRAHRWLNLLTEFCILELVEVGSQNPADHRASRFRYLEQL